MASGMTQTKLPPGTADKVVAKLFPAPDPYMYNPSLWLEEKLGEKLWSKQEEVKDSVVANRYTAVQSCHDSGKSYTASRLMSWWIDSHPDGDAFVVSTAPSQTQVEAILWREVGRAHRKGELKGRITYGQVPQWKLGNEIVGYGRKPQDLNSIEEAMAAFQGIHAKYVLIVIDEAGGVPKWLFDAVDTLATNEAARVLAIGNPDDPASHFERVCRPGSGWNVIQISAFDTPNFTDEQVHEDVSDLLLSRLWVEERKRRWGIASPLYISKVLAEFPEVSDDTLISPAMLKLACAVELPGLDSGQFGGDIARHGDDETVAYRNRGGVIRLERSAHKQDLMKTAGMFAALVEPFKGKVPIVVDSDGLGVGVYDRLAEQNLPVIEWRGGARARDDKHFINRRAEVYWHLREEMAAGRIDLDPNDEDALAQLGSIKYDIDSSGRIKVEKKREMRERGLPSPDRADTIMMSVRPRTVWPAEMVPDKNRMEKKAKSMTAGLRERKL